MELNPSWETSSRSTIQEFSNVCIEPGGSFPSLQGPSTDSYPEPYQSSRLHAIRSLLRFSLILPSHLCPGLSSALFPSDFSTRILHAFRNYPMRSTCPVHLILLAIIVLIILDEEYKSLSPVLCSCLQPPITSYSPQLRLLPPSVFLHTSV
jgi:hypothetical protein